MGIFVGISLWITYVIGDEVIAGWLLGNQWAVPLFILFKAISVVFAPLSGSVLYVLAPVLWPSWLAVLYVSIGNAIGISVAYWLGYRYGDLAIQKFVGKNHLKQAHSIIGKIHGYWKFLLFRLLFFPLEDLINFVGGMAKVPFWWFFLVSMIITTGLFVLFVSGVLWVEKIL